MTEYCHCGKKLTGKQKKHCSFCGIRKAIEHSAKFAQSLTNEQFRHWYGMRKPL